GTIASYRIFRNGTFVGSSSTPSFVDSGLAPETSYTYRVSARDPSGNESPLSSPASATTPQSSGGDPVLFAGWAFEETSGTAINDSSGNGRHGTLVSPATRNASGRFGRAIEVNGQSGHVDLGGLDVPGSELTLSCWFFADSFAIHDARLISKANGIQDENHWWMLSTISSGGPKPRFRLKTSNGGTTTLIGSTSLSTGQWTHLAATYDGAAMRLYVNGNPAGSVAKSGTLATNPSVLAMIGNNPGGGRAFDGRIDEVRIHARALTQGEIQALMTVPIGSPPAGDTSPPTTPSGLSATATSSSGIALSWNPSTDDSGTVDAYRVFRNGSFIASVSSTSYNDSGLSPATSYTYRVSAVDPSGNESALSSAASATTHSASDTT
ncbi:MAG TPA: LamG-like jellyroll fold domain-containing protein, partial [Planctomycetota bacterium]|nr:LamG-like jellyroll fold domain-containing protein [Planctomycetota bacterium]